MNSNKEAEVFSILQKLKDENKKQNFHKQGKSKKSSNANAKTDLSATVREAAKWQYGRGDTSLKIKVEKDNIVLKKYKPKAHTEILCVLDTSRSQGFESRLSFAKGLILNLLSKAYVDREKAGLIVFSDRKAEMLIPVTKSAGLAARQLEKIKASGNTPLAEGLEKAFEYIEYRKKRENELLSIMLIVTDGKGNFAQNGEDPLEAAWKAAKKISTKDIKTLVADTENSVFGLKLAKKLADILGGEYIAI